MNISMRGFRISAGRFKRTPKVIFTVAWLASPKRFWLLTQPVIK
jgi:hypothetical protein